MQLTRKYLIGSIIFHMVVLVIATIIGLHQSALKKTFVVFGAHSRKHSFVSYKPTKVVPFVSQPKRKLLAQNGHGNGKGRHTNGKVSNRKASHKPTKQTRNKKASKKAPAKRIKSKPVKSKAKAKARPIKKTKPKPAPKPKKVAASKVPELEEAGDKVKVTKNKQKPHKPAPKAKKAETEPKNEPETKAVEKQEPEPVEPPKAASAITPVAQNDASPDDISPEDEEAATGSDDDDDSSIIDFNLIGDDETNDQQRKVYQKHVQREVDRLWRPPVGVPKGTICTVLFTVNAEGEVENTKFLNRSSMLIYDLSIMRIAKSFKFAHCLWNKQFKIDFKQ